MDFEIHHNFLTKIFLVDLPLCRIFLENERHYPWILLVPRRRNVSKIMDLSPEDQLQLLHELDVAQNVLWNEFHPLQLNVAAIGNKTPQLHIHVIARFENDPAWPGSVWDHPVRATYATDQLNQVQEILQRGLQSISVSKPKPSKEHCLLKQIEKQEFEAKEFGFYWENFHQLIEQIQSECVEIQEEWDNENSLRLQEEVGDLIQATISLAVFCKLDPHETLLKSIEKFQQRYDAVVQMARSEGYDNLRKQSFELLMDFWNRAKLKTKPSV